MDQDGHLRLYATFKNTPALLSIYRRGDLTALTGFTVRLLRAAQRRAPPEKTQTTRVLAAATPSPPGESEFAAVSAPSLDWRANFTAPTHETSPKAADVVSAIVPDEFTIAYRFSSPDGARAFLRIVNDHRNVPLDDDGNEFRAAGFDPGNEVANHWCPGMAKLAMFGHRDHARRTVRASALAQHGFRGQHVNVVIVDQGLDKALIPPANWGGGLDYYLDNELVQPAGSAPRDSHGMMIARSILDLAPAARIYDLPMISPTKPPNIPIFVSNAQAAFENLMGEIRHRRALPGWSGPWILVNAWGIYDTSLDPSGSYTENKESHGHPFINLLTRAVQDDHLDIVFAAGNCGQFCPSRRCGDRDRGPNHSIWGANAHPLVLTVGAVRSDETWVGYSSQGPGPELLGMEKPDLCAPSQFCETYDAMSLSSGTSAACAMAAGVVAALRGNAKWSQTAVPPAAMKAALTVSARKPAGPAGWDGRLGFGIIDAASVIASLPA